MSPQSTDPRDRLGVFKHYADVPPAYRLDQYEAAYADRNVWQSFLTEYLFERYNSARFKTDAQRVEREWKRHMNDCGRHYALARPTDVESWCERLCESYSLKTAYNSYWVRIERFYEWLLWHRAYPHTYQPVVMAALEGPAAQRIWREKMPRGQSQ
jgi:hypothetical protein